MNSPQRVTMARISVPDGWEFDDGGPGWCMHHCYRGVEKKTKMCYLLGAHPSWGTVLDYGNFDDVSVWCEQTMDGTWKIYPAPGSGVQPKDLPIPRAGVVGGQQTTLPLLAMIGSIMWMMAGWSFSLSFCLVDQLLERLYLGNVQRLGASTRRATFLVMACVLVLKVSGVDAGPTDYQVFFKEDHRQAVIQQLGNYPTVETVQNYAQKQPNFVSTGIFVVSRMMPNAYCPRLDRRGQSAERILVENSMKLRKDRWFSCDGDKPPKPTNQVKANKGEMLLICGVAFVIVYVVAVTVKATTNAKRKSKLLVPLLLFGTAGGNDGGSNSNWAVYEIERMEADPYYEPVELKGIHVAYMETLDFELKDYNLCTRNDELRDELLAANLSEEEMVSYFEFACPQLAFATSDLWLKQAKRRQLATRANKRRSYTQVRDDTITIMDHDTKDVLDVAGRVHEIVKDSVDAVLHDTDKMAQRAGRTARRVVNDAAGLSDDLVNRVYDANHKTMEKVLVLLAENDDLPGEVLEEVTRAIKKLGKGINKSVGPDKVATVLQGVVDEGVDTIQNLVTETPKPSDVATDVGKTLSKVWSTVTDIGSNTNTVIDTVITKGPKADDIATDVWDVASWTKGTVKDGVDSLITNFKERWKETTVEGLVDGAPWLTQKMGETVAGPIKGFVETVPWPDWWKEDTTSWFGRLRRNIFGDWSDGFLPDFRGGAVVKILTWESPDNSSWMGATLVLTITTAVVASVALSRI